MTGFVFAIVAAILFGVGGTFAQFLFTQRGISPEWLVTMRLLVAGGVLVLLSALRDPRATLAVWRSDAVPLLLFGVVGMLGMQYTYFAAIAASNTATATVLQYTAPAMVGVWLAVRAGRRPSSREAGAVLLALAGTLLLMTHGDPSSLQISTAAVFWGLGSAVTAAFNAIQPGGLLARHGAARVTGWGMLVGGIALSAIHPPWLVPGQWDAVAVLFTAFVLLFGTLVAFYVALKALQMIGAQKSSILTCAEPMAAAVLAVTWLGVSWSAMDWLGMACILLTVLLLAREQTQANQMEHVT